MDVDGDDEERESGGEAETWAEKEKGPESANICRGLAVRRGSWLYISTLPPMAPNNHANNHKPRKP